MRKQYFWNTAAGILNAAEAIIFGMIINRITGIDDSGVITLAFSVGNLFASIGRWGVRTFQVVDGGEYSFKEYLNVRIITTIIQLFTAFAYVISISIINGYALDKSVVIILMVLIYSTDVIEDVFGGHFQKNNHIETGAQLFILRWISIIISFGVTLFITKKIIIAMAVSTLFAFIILFIALIVSWAPYKCNIEKHKGGEITILKKCLPIMLTQFVSFYTLNAAKFSIDSVLSDSEVAIYGFISMPVFAISLLSGFIYYPQILPLSNDYRSGDIKKYTKRLKKQIGIISLLTAFVSICAWFFGITVLEIIYSVDLSGFKLPFMILVVTGGLYAVVAYLNQTLVIEKKNSYPLIAYSVAAIMSLVLYRPLISNMGINGAALGFFIVMLSNVIMSLVFEFISLKICIRKEY